MLKFHNKYYSLSKTFFLITTIPTAKITVAINITNINCVVLFSVLFLPVGGDNVISSVALESGSA